jgi:hypothetical protein
LTIRKLCTIMLCTFLITFTFIGIGRAAPEETHNVYYLEYAGLKIEVSAPVKAYIGESIDVTVNTESVVPEIFIKYLNINLYGRVEATTEISLDQITHLTNSYLSSSYEAQYNVKIPENISPGLTYGIINCEWEFMGSSQKIPNSGFVLTYIQGMELEQLQAEFDELNATHQSLIQNFTELESTLEGEVGSTRNLLYVFVATTVVGSITVVVLLMRKPKTVWS